MSIDISIDIPIEKCPEINQNLFNLCNALPHTEKRDVSKVYEHTPNMDLHLSIFISFERTHMSIHICLHSEDMSIDRHIPIFGVFLSTYLLDIAKCMSICILTATCHCISNISIDRDISIFGVCL